MKEGSCSFVCQTANRPGRPMGVAHQPSRDSQNVRMKLKCDAAFNCFISLIICFLLSVTYVGSLYIWRTTHHRDHPDVVRKRFISVLIMFCLSPLFLYVGIDAETLDKIPFNVLLGFRTNGLLQATLIPWFLTMVLFLGPLSMHLYRNCIKVYKEPSYWMRNFTDLLWIRNSLVAPLSEEFTFRSCMVPILLQCFRPQVVVFINPLFFGVAHFHHLQERRRQGLSLKIALQISCFQFAFTTLFGAYSAYIFLRTGHFISIFMIHAFCNLMGFPNIEEIMNYETPKRLMIFAVFLTGAISWMFLFTKLTEPSLYQNEVFWVQNAS